MTARSPVVAMRRALRPMTSLSLMAISGCASLSGMPEPVIPLSASLDIAAKYPIETALDDIARLPDDDKKRVYRDKVVNIYLNAADARYRQFVARLSNEMKTTNLGLDVAILGVTGAGAVVGSNTANLLSASAAGLSGVRTSVSKELYYEQTLIAVIANMDAARLGVKTSIMQNLRDHDINQYSLEQAFSDISAYQDAARLERALGKLTTDAVTNASQKEAEYKIAFESCKPSAAVGALWGRLNDGIYDLFDAVPPDVGNVDIIAGIIGATPTGTKSADDQVAEMVLQINKRYCTVDSMSDLLSQIKTKTGKAF